MCLLCINKVHATDTKVAECCEGVQVSAALVQLPLLMSGFLIILFDYLLHQPAAFWAETRYPCTYLLLQMSIRI